MIRDLYGVVTSERANKGILITYSKFSKQAKEFANNLPIELIDGNELVKLFLENQDNYENIRELKNQCNEIIKTMNLVENEKEKLISISPPDGLLQLHKTVINIYKPFFNFFSEFLYKL